MKKCGLGKLAGKKRARTRMKIEFMTRLLTIQKRGYWTNYLWHNAKEYKEYNEYIEREQQQHTMCSQRAKRAIYSYLAAAAAATVEAKYLEISEFVIILSMMSGCVLFFIHISFIWIYAQFGCANTIPGVLK